MTANEPRPPDELTGLVGVGARLRVDRWTAEVVTGLRRVGIEPILLKGPVVRRWLYADDEPLARTYTDVDLLVAPWEQPRAAEALRAMGFIEPVPALPGEWPEHARSWSRSRDGALVDLHRCLHGTEGVPAERLWEAIAERLESQTVAGIEVSVPNEVVRTLHVALHVDSTDAPGSSPRNDLERAARLVERSTWEQAAELARELGIEAEVGTRLRVVPTTVPLADDLGLPAGGVERFELRQAVHEAGAGPGAYAVARLGSLRGRARARYVLRKLFPPPDFMRRWSAIARRGRLGLVTAYVGRVAWCAGRAPAALAGWWRTRRHLR